MIKASGKWLKDQHGRTVLLRGVSLGGSSKVPRTPDGATHIRQGFFDHRDVSFTGRPFPLEEADEHLRRLRAWGFDLVRLLVPWEAVEHAGPGIYDQAYLDYLYFLIERAEELGIQVIIDPHQDVWSRFSGGDGAPGCGIFSPARCGRNLADGSFRQQQPKEGGTGDGRCRPG